MNHPVITKLVTLSNLLFDHIIHELATKCRLKLCRNLTHNLGTLKMGLIKVCKLAIII